MTRCMNWLNEMIVDKMHKLFFQCIFFNSIFDVFTINLSNHESKITSSILRRFFEIKLHEIIEEYWTLFNSMWLVISSSLYKSKIAVSFHWTSIFSPSTINVLWNMKNLLKWINHFLSLKIKSFNSKFLIRVFLFKSNKLIIENRIMKIKFSNCDWLLFFWLSFNWFFDFFPHFFNSECKIQHLSRFSRWHWSYVALWFDFISMVPGWFRFDLEIIWFEKCQKTKSIKLIRFGSKHWNLNYGINNFFQLVNVLHQKRLISSSIISHARVSWNFY